MSFIRLIQVEKSFGVTKVLRGLNFTIADKELVAIRGASGSGKSTLIKILAGLTHADRGSVAVDGADFGHILKLYRLRDGLLPPKPASYIEEAPLTTFDVDDLLILRGALPSPAGKMLGERDDAYTYGLLAEYSEALEHYGGDVLRGDFTVFRELDGVVKQRAREMLHPPG